VQPHPRPQRSRQLPCLGQQRALRRERGGKRVGRPREGGVHVVAGHLHDLAAVGANRLAQERVVTRQPGAHQLGALFPQRGLALQVGEQERHRARRQGHKAASLPFTTPSTF
jgi:hypothetical protein